VRWSLKFLLAVCLMVPAWVQAQETRKEFDILAAADQSVRGVVPIRCFAAPRNFQAFAHACYKVAPKDVPRVVRRLERRLDHPPLLTHGDNWHGHGFGIVPLPQDMRQSFSHRSDPSRVVSVINFTAPSQIKSFSSDLKLPPVAELGTLPGFIYVQILPAMPVFRE